MLLDTCTLLWLTQGGGVTVEAGNVSAINPTAYHSRRSMRPDDYRGVPSPPHASSHHRPDFYVVWYRHHLLKMMYYLKTAHPPES
jgi:hypothetical protein